VAGDRITWEHCASGFVWRIWLGLYILPGWPYYALATSPTRDGRSVKCGVEAEGDRDMRTRKPSFRADTFQLVGFQNTSQTTRRPGLKNLRFQDS
jgi:hypothetical protein